MFCPLVFSAALLSYAKHESHYEVLCQVCCAGTVALCACCDRDAEPAAGKLYVDSL